MSHSTKTWTALLRSWDIGAASQLEHARRYTTEMPTEPGGWVAMAVALGRLARYKDAKAALRKAERLTPQQSRYRIWEQWGLLYREMNDLPAAESWFRKAVDAHPSTRAHIFLGATLAKQGRRDEAERQLRALIARATPTQPLDEAHLNLALILRSKGNYKEAVKHLHAALKIDPTYPEARAVLRDVRRAIRFAGE